MRYNNIIIRVMNVIQSIQPVFFILLFVFGQISPSDCGELRYKIYIKYQIKF
jgi:hypothetical protein